MKPFLEILPETFAPGKTNLICEVKKMGLSYYFQNDETKTIEGISVFRFDKKNSERDTSEVIKELFDTDQLLKEEYKKVVLIYAFDESVLIPGKYYNAEMNAEMLELVYGDLQEGTIFTDVIKEKDIYNIFRIPSSLHNTLITQFPTSEFAHQYSLLIKRLPNQNNLLQIILYDDKITVVLLKNGKLQIIQSFPFIHNEDVIYNLLNLCEQFEIENISIELNGMIEKDSPLSKEIHKYFLNVSFNDSINGPVCDERLKEHPSHFFNYLFSIAACV